MMATRLALILCLLGLVFAKESPDVDCVVINLQYVECTWNTKGTPDVNYTFYSRFHYDEKAECANYMSENGTNVGCQQPNDYISLRRFSLYYTELVHGNNSFLKEHNLKNKVKLNPPTNLTVLKDSDSNLLFKWNQTFIRCVESEVRYKINNNKWDTATLSKGRMDFYINLPATKSIYELQVRSRIEKSCGESLWWSDWSESVYWGSNSKGNK